MNPDPANRPERPTVGIKIGSRVLSGPPAVAVLLLVLALVAALLIWSRPSLRMLITGGIWVAFVAYWSAAARNAAPAASSESPASRAVHTRLLNLALLLLFVPLPGLRGRFLPGGTPVVAMGLAVQALGFALAAWARNHLGRNWSAAIASATGHQLVRSGPYRVVRHPIYTAMFTMAIGTAIVSGEFHALAAIVVLGAAYWRKIRLEEQTLVSTFGAEYEEYRRATWALVPGLF